MEKRPEKHQAQRFREEEESAETFEGSYIVRSIQDHRKDDHTSQSEAGKRR